MGRFATRLRRIAFLLLIAAATVTGHAQHYPILPVSNSPHGIFALLQDSQSALWVGTINNVYRFDGERFYSLRQYGFPEERVSSFAEDSNGGIWIATQTHDPQSDLAGGGIYRYQGGKVEKLLTGAAFSLVNSGYGTMLATVMHRVSEDSGDLYMFHETGRVWHSTKLLEEAAGHLSVDHQGNVLFPCRRNICEFSANQIQNSDRIVPRPASKLAFRSDAVRYIRDRFGCLWLRTYVALNYSCDGATLHTVSTSVVGQNDTAYIVEMDDGSILTVGPGLAHGRPEAMHFAGEENGLPVGVNTALPARDGTIFLGTKNGLYRFMLPFRLEYWAGGDGVDSPYGILPVGGRVFASNLGIRLLDRTRSRWVPWASPKNLGTVVHMLPGRNGSIYAASIIRGVTQIGPDGTVMAHSVSGPGGAKLAQDKEGHTWLAGQGVTLVTRRGTSLDLTSQGMPDGTSLDLAYDQKRNALWACHDREVVRLESNRWTHITRDDGLLDDFCRSVTVLPDGDVWIEYGVLGSLSRIHPTGANSFHVDHYRYPNPANNPDDGFLGVDSRGWLWRGRDGSNFVATSEAATRGEWLPLTAQDGFPVPGGNQNSFANDPDGSIWFASENTIVHFRPPDGLATRFMAPAIFVGGISSGRDAPRLPGTLGRIKSADNVVAHVGSVLFERRDAIRLRYRLLPHQSGWTETKSFDLPLGKLRWGHYTLQVQAQLFTGPWSPMVEQTLIVEWPVWLSWPFLLAYAAPGAGLGAGVFYWRRERKLERELSLPDLSSWRMSALSPEADSLIGTRVDGRYEIGHILSVGGFATVVRARDLQNQGQLCAVKIFRYEFGDRAWIRHRFEQEISALEQLSHPNVVRITGHGTIESGAPYLVMEFIYGQTLRDHLDQNVVPRPQIGLLLHQIAGALHSLHERAIYHRDLKPENLMIRVGDHTRPEIVLIDFTIAIVKSRDQTFHGISRVAGTLEYMAPEQVIGFADASTDIYALAKIVMEMLTGLRWSDLFPEAALDLPQQIRAHFASSTIFLCEDSINHIVSAMAFDPAARPKDVLEFVRPIVRDLELLP